MPPVGYLNCGIQRRTPAQRPWRAVLRQQTRCRNTREETQYTTNLRTCDHARKGKWWLFEFDVRQRDTSASGRREWNLLTATGKSCCIATCPQADKIVVQAGNVEMMAIAGGSVFLAPVTIGGQQFYVVIDTGSSDPWIADKDFTCIDPTTNLEVEEQYCYFGPLYDKTTSPTFEPLPDRSLNLSYADGETLNGLMGRDAFTMGGITFDAQEFGMVDYAAWYGDGVSSGLIGFAYRTLTSMYSGEDPKNAVA